MLTIVQSSQVVVIALLLTTVYWFGSYIYLSWFHRLSRYPGPPLAAISELWYALAWTGGSWNIKISEAHRKYGDIIRIAPNELSFATAQSFKDIYGPPSKSKKLFLKSDRFYDTEYPSLALVTDPEEHARQAKLFLPQFRMQAVRTQEHVIHKHVDLFIDQVTSYGASGTTLNMSEWCEWLTFDIIGELTFGESFNAIRDTKTHPWVSILLSATYSGSIFNLRKRIPLLGLILRYMPYISSTARNAVDSIAEHSKLTLAKTRKRIETGPASDTVDFLQLAINTGTVSPTELASQAMVLLTAGAETTATALASTLWYLSQPAHAHCLQRLRAELSSALPLGSDITGDAVAQLPYLHAVLEESMRLFPPSPVGPPRVAPKGGEYVDGTFVPEGVYVSTDIWTLHRDQRNVEDKAEVFEPARWVDEGWRRPYTVPFSIGPRMCIGVNLACWEMNIALAKIVRAFEWELVQPDGKDWVEQAQLRQLWLKAPLMLRFRPAEKTE